MSSSAPPQATRFLAPRLVRITQLWGGAALMLGNLLFILNKLDEMSQVFLSRWMPDLISGRTPGRLILGQLALIVGYLAYFHYYAPRAGRLGRAGLCCFCGGGTLLALGHVGFLPAHRLGLSEAIPWMLVIIGLVVMLLGLLTFGIANLRQHVLGCWRWLPLITALMGLIGFFGFGGEESRALFLTFRTLFALGLIGLGLALWLERPAPPELAR